MAESDKRWSPYASVYDPIKVGSIDGTATYPHDRAVVRACQATYHPNPKLDNDPDSTLFVGRLDEEVTEDDLTKVFSRHGPLRKVTLVRDIVTGFSKKYGFVEFINKNDCVRAQRKEHNTTLNGRKILVDFECQHTLPGWIPRRLGGGFGGRKESGQLRFGCLDRPWKKPVVVVHKSRPSNPEDIAAPSSSREGRPNLRARSKTPSPKRREEQRQPDRQKERRTDKERDRSSDRRRKRR